LYNRKSVQSNLTCSCVILAYYIDVKLKYWQFLNEILSTRKKTDSITTKIKYELYAYSLENNFQFNIKYDFFRHER